MSELLGELCEKPDRQGFVHRVLQGLMMGAYEQMGLSPETVAVIAQEENVETAASSPDSPPYSTDEPCDAAGYFM